jgi:hypothetical protein
MMAGKARVLACACAAALGVALLVSGCAGTSSSSSVAPGPATPTVIPQAAPELGTMSYGTFPASTYGMDALTVCEQWAMLRVQYAGRLRAETPYQLEEWFSDGAWQTAFRANKPIKTDPDFSQISTAFGLVSTGAAASVPNAKWLDKACANAD